MSSNESELKENAERLANTMYSLAQWSKSHPNAHIYKLGLFRLPPFFTNSENGIQRLTAMIKTIDDYDNNRIHKLSDLTYQFNKYAKANILNENDYRKIHNWMQQISFGIRAAVIEDELIKAGGLKLASNKADIISQNVYNRLYARTRPFIAYAQDSKYEFKPLKHASSEAKLRWINQEVNQRLSHDHENYGAKPSAMEWEVFGLKGHSKTAIAQIHKEFLGLLRHAQELDNNGFYEDADSADLMLVKMSKSIEYFSKNEKDLN